MFLYTKELAEQLTKAIESVEVKAVDAVVSKMIISEEKADRDGETILLSGGSFENYQKSPVVLMDHSYRVENIVGKTTSLKVEGKQLIAEWVWADTENAQLAKQLYDSGFLKTSSIGFMPMQRQENDRKIITKWELLEWSLVAVPCNPGALSMDGKALYQKGIDVGFIKEGEPMTETPEEPTEEPKQNDFETKILSEIAELKVLVATLANGKAKSEATEAEVTKLKEQKEILQAISRGMSSVLENVKKL